MNLEPVRSQGDVDIIIDWKDGSQKRFDVKNTILLTGRRSQALALANAIGDSYQFYITKMIFGDGGTVNGVKKYVNANRNGLFGVTQVSKPVIANMDNSIPSQVIFTSVLRFDEAIGVTLSEMALQMATGDLYSMTTFPDLNKTSDIQITYNWRINYI